MMAYNADLRTLKREYMYNRMKNYQKLPNCIGKRICKTSLGKMKTKVVTKLLQPLL